MCGSPRLRLRGESWRVDAVQGVGDHRPHEAILQVVVVLGDPENIELFRVLRRIQRRGEGHADIRMDDCECLNLGNALDDVGKFEQTARHTGIDVTRWGRPQNHVKIHAFSRYCLGPQARAGLIFGYGAVDLRGMNQGCPRRATLYGDDAATQLQARLKFGPVCCILRGFVSWRPLQRTSVTLWISS